MIVPEMDMYLAGATMSLTIISLEQGTLSLCWFGDTGSYTINGSRTVLLKMPEGILSGSYPLKWRFGDRCGSLTVDVKGLEVDVGTGAVWLKTSLLAPIMIGVMDERNVYAYPNPATSYITLKGFNPGAIVKIFTIVGELVNTLEDRDMDGVEIWGLKNTNGEDVASGVYMWTVMDKDGKVSKGKVGVIK